uniref:Lectin alpha chain-like n=1 Tax=Elaeis guineensis var. tenera TaxID=51953 RepID=A0A8N4I5M9_ELAGV
MTKAQLTSMDSSIVFLPLKNLAWQASYTSQAMAPCNSRSLHIPVLLFPLLSVLIPHASPLSFNFTGDELDKSNLNFSGNAHFDAGLQLTNNQVNTNLYHSIGSATYYKPVSLWDKASGTVANFTTNFRFAINGFGQNVSADGLAFFLSPFPFEAPSNSSGVGLGLFTNNDFVGQPNTGVVAVEFDSFKNPLTNDISANHVGIDIGSINSTAQVDLNASIRENGSFIASISYNSVTQNLSVFLRNDSNPPRNWSLFYVANLSKLLPENVAIGFSAATGARYETHTIYSWDFNSSDLSSQYLAPGPASSPSIGFFEAKHKSKMRLVVKLAIGIGILLCVLGLVLFVVWHKRANGGMEEEEEMALELSIHNAFKRGGGPKKFSYRALAIATRNFVKEAKLGEGGFGEVYMGVLHDTE